MLKKLIIYKINLISIVGIIINPIILKFILKMMEYHNIIPLEPPFPELWPLIVPELYKDQPQDKIIPEINRYLIPKALKKLLDGNDYF